MFRSLSVVAMGFLALVVGGGLALALLLAGRSYFFVNNSGDPAPPTVVIAEQTPVVVLPSATPTVNSGEESPTAGPSTATQEPTPNTLATATPSPTPIVVLDTTVQYVLAKADVNIRSGPGTGYQVVGWVAEGQIARVTGVNSNGWWRVVCPNDTSGSCWVTGGSQYTVPTTAPGSTPTATPTATACTNSAALVADVTVPDGTQFGPADGFVKTWRLRNTGTCLWNTEYRLVFAGGNTMGALANSFRLDATVAPGELVDVSVSLVAPTTPDTYQGDWKLQSDKGAIFGLGRNGAPFYVRIVVATAPAATISGIVYYDTNQNGVYNDGEPLVAGREVWLVSGTACHVRSNAVAIAVSDASGRYTLANLRDGSYCVGLAGEGGLDDVASVVVSPGQVVTGINLKANTITGSISGWVWHDYCQLRSNNVWDGACVANGDGSYRADGMLQANEENIAGVTVLLQAGACATGNPSGVTAVTNSAGRYTFSNLQPGQYCVSVQATAPENVSILLPGEWTFPQPGIWYQQIEVLPGAHVGPVNFGWDYQFS